MSSGRTTADRLLGQIFLWIFEGQKCSIMLREQSKELESLVTKDGGLSTGGKIALRILLIPYGLYGLGMFSLINRLFTSASVSNVALKAKLEKDEIKSRKCSKTEEKVVQLNEKLKSESQQKNPDDVDRHVLSELLKALVKLEGLTDPSSVCAIQQFVKDFEENRLTSERFREAVTHLVNLLQFFDINVSLAAKQITIKQDPKAPCGSVGSVALVEALGNCKTAIKNNDGAKASKILKDFSDLILEATRKLSESVYEAQKSLASAVQSQTGQSGTRQYRSETGEDYGPKFTGGASGGAGGGRGGGGGGGWRKHEDDEDSGEDSSEDSGDEESSEETGRRHKELRMALLNVRSIGKKSIAKGNLMKNLILNHYLDFFLITETWLKPGSGDGVLQSVLPQNRNFIHQPRDYGRGGGVAIAFSDEFQCRPVSLKYYVSTFEYVAADVTHETWDRPVRILTVYLPPNQRNEEFTNFLCEFSFLLTDFSDKNSNIIVAGDFNIWIDDEKNKNVGDFLKILKDNNLEQFVNEPTHQAGHILDLVLSRNMEITGVRVQNDNLSDHFSLFQRKAQVLKERQGKQWIKYTQTR